MLHSSKLAMILITLDPLVTWFALNSGALEGNPIWNTLTYTLGITLAMAIRGVLGILLVVSLEFLIAHTKMLSRWVFKVLNIVFLVIVPWNLFVLVVSL